MILIGQLETFIKVITWFQNRRAKLKRDVDETGNVTSGSRPIQLETGSANSDTNESENSAISPVQTNPPSLSSEVQTGNGSLGSTGNETGNENSRRRKGNSLLIENHSNKKRKL